MSSQSRPPQEGLLTVTSVGESIKIKNHDKLSSLKGLDNIDSGSISGIYITLNNLLSSCEVQSVCDYIASPDASVIFNDNATGCNSEQEVELACQIIGIQEMNFETNFFIFPNPCGNTVHVVSREGDLPDEVVIYNQIGQKVLYIDHPSNSINVSTLNTGLYIVALVSGNSVNRVKLIKR